MSETKSIELHTVLAQTIFNKVGSRYKQKFYYNDEETTIGIYIDTVRHWKEGEGAPFIFVNKKCSIELHFKLDSDVLEAYDPLLIKKIFKILDIYYDD